LIPPVTAQILSLKHKVKMIRTIIIDDHRLFNDGLASIFKDYENFKIIGQIYDSRQAIHQCIALRPDLIIVDYNMPYLNGLEIVKQIKSIDKSCKIVIISMYSDRKEISLFMKEGVNGYINKTTGATTVIAALQKIMEGEPIIIGKDEQEMTESKDTFSLKHQLTKREIQIIHLLKRNFTSEQMATELKLSYYTIETHRRNINVKLKFKTRQEFYEFIRNF